ncbi:t-SNARE [Astrocystis sublimbata]|nr:t-SNARE [Astrocystis sublimbata]
MSYSNPYQQSTSAEQGYGNGYDGNQDHEMQDYGHSSGAQTLPTPEFLNRIDFLRNEIGTLTSNVEAIAQLHQRSLADADSGGNATQQLERISAETNTLVNGVRDQLKFLVNDCNHSTGGVFSTKERHIKQIKGQFERELQNYREEERSFKSRYRDQIARQYRIVNPDASEDEVRQAADADWGNEGVFQTAIRTNRTGQASSVLGAVRARHNELQRIEKTMMELADLFTDLETLVVQQEVPVQEAERNAENTKAHLDNGNQQVEKGIDHARKARKWKWWCLLIVILIIAIVVGVAVGVTQANKAVTGN